MSVYCDALTGAPAFGRPKDVTKDPRRRCKALIANKELGDEEAFLEGREMLMTQLLKTAREQNRVFPANVTRSSGTETLAQKSGS